MKTIEAKTIKARLEYLRRELRGERISTGELLELQSLAQHIGPDDVELLQAADVPEHTEDSETQFTPGPWDFSPSVGDYTAKDRLYIRSQAISHSNCSSDVIVAELKNHRYGSADRRPALPAEQIANARLIAAAPDLLALLKHCQHYIETPGDFAEHERSELLDDIESTLAKAQGQ